MFESFFTHRTPELEADAKQAADKSKLTVTCEADCPGKHGLQEFTIEHDDYVCDFCSRDITHGTTVYSCRPCNYDLCAACYTYGDEVVHDRLVAICGADGVPPYRAAQGSEIVARESTALSTASIQRFLKQHGGSASRTAAALVNMLRWRQRAFPNNPAEISSRVMALLEENYRWRCLGSNRDGDLVVAFHFCWGHFETDDASLLDVTRAMLLGVEGALEKADSTDHPQLVVICFGGPAPCQFAIALNTLFEKYYPGRLKSAVIYPVPAAEWAKHLVSIFSQDVVNQVVLTGDEDVVVNHARLTSSEQLPEDWRGGIDRVTERHQPDTKLLNSVVLGYLNPFGETGTQLLEQLETSWSS